MKKQTSSKTKTTKKTHSISAAGRARIAAAQVKRWKAYRKELQKLAGRRVS